VGERQIVPTFGTGDKRRRTLQGAESGVLTSEGSRSDAGPFRLRGLLRKRYPFPWVSCT
jgi:hypothetical protein